MRLTMSFAVHFECYCLLLNIRYNVLFRLCFFCLKTLFTVLEAGSGRVSHLAMSCLPETAALQCDGQGLRSWGHLFNLWLWRWPMACHCCIFHPDSLWCLHNSLLIGGTWDPHLLPALEMVKVSFRQLTPV